MINKKGEVEYGSSSGTGMGFIILLILIALAYGLHSMGLFSTVAPTTPPPASPEIPKELILIGVGIGAYLIFWRKKK